MERTIKFRAWDKTKKRFGYFHLTPFGIDIPEGGYMPVRLRYSADQELYRLEYDNIVFQEYTGLKDKNGDDIFEGDILNKKLYREGGSGNYNSLPRFYDDTEITVGFAKGCFSGILYPSVLSREIGKYDNPSQTEYEIIGNIFEGKRQ